MFEKLLVANRGEIAIRVMQACEELGIDTVAIYSDADRNAGHVEYADEAYNVGPAPANESYLNQETIVETANEAGVDAIHPGYGFLAENAEFAARVEEEDGLTWVGPSSDAMKTLGEKTEARRVMREADVPVVPGTTEPVESAERVQEIGDEYGYPLAIKAEGGGGGRGMKIVYSDEEVADALESAQREGEAYFDNSSVYVEKYLDDPKHIEVQILADQNGNVLHLGERDCSLQRRHQKIIEEAPSPALDDELRKLIGESARRGVRKAGYTNAGTVEFLVEDGEFYFMEVNTRIQVEHTVTEEITGIDIVRQQLRIAAGKQLPISQSDVDISGHAMEFRINAEDPSADFAPTPGTLTTYDPPSGLGVRLDDAVSQGDEVTGDYDSMISKLIIRGPTRDRCLSRSERALSHFDITGIQTVIPFHRLMLEDSVFRSGEHTTKYLDQEITDADLDAAVDRWGDTATGGTTGTNVSANTNEITVEVDDRRYEVFVEDTISGEPATGSDSPTASESSSPAESNTDGALLETGDAVSSEMAGTVLSINVSPGDQVDQGEVLCVLEAMKMENDVVASAAGTIAEVPIAEGDSIDTGDPLVIFE